MRPEGIQLNPEVERLRERYMQDQESRIFAPLADAYRKSGMLDEAIEICQKGLERHSNYISAHVILARCYQEKGITPKAKEQFAKVLELDRYNLVALKALGDIAEQEELPEEAFKWYSGFVDVDPTNTEIRNKLVNLKESSGAVLIDKVVPGNESKEEMDNSENAGGSPDLDYLKPDEGRVEELPESKIAVTESDEDDLDSVFAEDTERLDSDRKEITTETLAEIYSEQGLYNKALRIYEQKLADDPESKELQNKVMELREKLEEGGTAKQDSKVDEGEIQFQGASISGEDVREEIDGGEGSFGSGEDPDAVLDKIGAAIHGIDNGVINLKDIFDESDIAEMEKSVKTGSEEDVVEGKDENLISTNIEFGETAIQEEAKDGKLSFADLFPDEQESKETRKKAEDAPSVDFLGELKAAEDEQRIQSEDKDQTLSWEEYAAEPGQEDTYSEGEFVREEAELESSAKPLMHMGTGKTAESRPSKIPGVKERFATIDSLPFGEFFTEEEKQDIGLDGEPANGRVGSQTERVQARSDSSQIESSAGNEENVYTYVPGKGTEEEDSFKVFEDWLKRLKG